MGIPGTRANITSITETVEITFGCMKICSLNSWPRSFEAVDLVTSRPAPVETIRAGICVTKPSPTVRRV